MARSQAQLIFYISHVYQRMTPPFIQFVNHNIQEFSLISLPLPYPHELFITIAHHFCLQNVSDLPSPPHRPHHPRCVQQPSAPHSNSLSSLPVPSPHLG